MIETVRMLHDVTQFIILKIHWNIKYISNQESHHCLFLATHVYYSEALSYMVEQIVGFQYFLGWAPIGSTTSTGNFVCVCVVLAKLRAPGDEHSILQIYTEARLVLYKQLSPRVQYCIVQLGPNLVPHLLYKVAIFLFLFILWQLKPTSPSYTAVHGTSAHAETQFQIKSSSHELAALTLNEAMNHSTSKPMLSTYI